jgi:hypothetical protein
MRGSRFDYCGPRIRIAAGDGAARGHWFSALSPSRKSRLPSREHGLDLRPPHLRNGGNWSLSIPTKTTPTGPPPPFFLGGLAIGKHLSCWVAKFCWLLFRSGLLLAYKSSPSTPNCPTVLLQRSATRPEDRGPKCGLRVAAGRAVGRGPRTVTPWPTHRAMWACPVGSLAFGGGPCDVAHTRSPLVTRLFVRGPGTSGLTSCSV